MTDHNVGSPMMQSNLRSQTPVMNQANQNNSNSQSGMHPPHQVSAILNSLKSIFKMEFLAGRINRDQHKKKILRNEISHALPYYHPKLCGLAILS